MATEGVELVRRGDMMSEGNYLLVTKAAPDVAVSFRWFADRNANGVHGLLITDSGTNGMRGGTHKHAPVRSGASPTVGPNQ